MLSSVNPETNQLTIYLSNENYSTDKLMLSENIISAKIVYKRYFSNGMEKLVKKLNEINQLKEIQLINQEHLFNRDPTDWDSDIKTIIDMVNANSSISSLTLEYFNISFDAAKALADFIKTNKNLQKLSFQKHYVDLRGRSLINQAIRDNKIITELSIDDSLNYNNLELQTYRQSGFSDRDLYFLRDALKANESIKHLTLSSLHAISILWVLDILRDNPRIESLNIANLKDVLFSNNDADGAVFFDFFQEITHYPIKKLNISRQALTPHDQLSLINFLRKNKTLTDINLEGCFVDNETIISLMEVTKDNKNLEKINLIRNGDYNNNLSTLKAILAALANNIALKELNLIEENILDNYLYLSSEEHASHFNKINELVTNNASIHAALSKTHFAENNHIQDLLNVKTAISAEGMQKINHVIVRSMHSLQDLCLNAVHKFLQNEKISLKMAQTRLPAELFNQVNPNVDKRETKFKLTKFNLFQSSQSEQSSTAEKTIYWKLGK